MTAGILTPASCIIGWTLQDPAQGVSIMGLTTSLRRVTSPPPCFSGGPIDHVFQWVVPTGLRIGRVCLPQLSQPNNITHFRVYRS